MSTTPTEGTPNTPSGEGGSNEPTEPATGTNQPTNDEANLGDAGKKALDAMKAKWKAAEQKAKENAQAATRLAEIEDAQKTEAQRAADALATERKRADEAAREALSLRIATEHHLGAEDAELLAGLPDEDAMRKLAKRLEAQAADNGEQSQQQAPPRVGYGVDHSKTQSSPPPSDDDAARAFFGI